ncbi:hypothetical protein SDC9_205733 [bioreactor metagenome]|uniref:DUF445 domain-containing protein n=1 Tax=bioreactor metagenome TaxID=1076179 RepID=A0A645J3L5_9ZZZZ
MEYINEQISAEGMPLLDSIIDGLMNKLNEEVKVGDIVEKKINEFDLMKIEEMILNIANTELKHIEVLGGVLGFIIGLIQGIIIQFI